MKKSILKKTTAYLSAMILAASGFNVSAKTPQNCLFDSPDGSAIYTRPVIANHLKHLSRTNMNIPIVQIYYDGIFSSLMKKYDGVIDFQNRRFINFKLARCITGSKDGLLNDGKIVMMRAVESIFSEPLRALCNFILNNENLTPAMYEQIILLNCGTSIANAVLYIRSGQGVTSKECIVEYFTVLEQIAQQLYSAPYVREALQEWYGMVKTHKQMLGIQG